MSRLAALTLLLALSACATAPRPSAPQTTAVNVIDNKLAVPTACVAQSFPPRQSFSDTRAALKAARDAAARYALMASNWEARDKRLSADEDQIEICRASAQSHPAGSDGR